MSGREAEIQARVEAANNADYSPWAENYAIDVLWLLAQLDDLRPRYGAKFNAITAALGQATEAEKLYEDGDEAGCLEHLDRVISILVDA